MHKHDQQFDWQQSYQKLVQFIRGRVASDDDARDIASSVMEKLLVEINNGKSPDNINAWLYRVTRNGIVDYYRSRKIAEPLPDDLVADNPPPSTLNSLSQCVLPLMQDLPEHYREPLLLSEIEGMKQKQVAEKLGLSLAAVKSRILRGREKLLQNLQRCCTLHRDSSDKIVDFSKNNPDSCKSCDS